MKKIFYILGAIFFVTNMYSQPLDVRASCASSGVTIKARVKNFTNQVLFNSANNSNPIGLIMVFSLNKLAGETLANAPVPTDVSTSFGFALASYPVAIVNSRFIYSYYAPNGSAIANQAAWAVGSEHVVMQITFPSSASGRIPRLDNLLNDGPNGFNYFYFEVNGVQRSDTEADPYYTGNGSEGTYSSGDQWVQPLNPLPVKLLSFSAEKSGDKSALLNWSTASESNSSYFGVERSYDKITWKTAGQVKAAGSSQIVLNYNFLDKDVYDGKSSSQIVYYRLKMVDFDNSFEYSPIESVNFGKAADNLVTNQNFIVYPNPASEGIHVQWDASQEDQPTALEFYDVSGKLIYTEKVEDQTSQQYVDFTKTNIQTGLCLMRVLSGDKAIDYKQIVVGQNH